MSVPSLSSSGRWLGLKRRGAAAAEADDTGPILSVEALTVALPKGADRALAVDHVSLELRRGEILCVVGESGSGKSALSGAIMGAPAPGLRVAGGSVRLRGRELTRLSERAWCRIRGNRIAMIFQEPMAALNPAIPVGRQIMEVFELHDRKLTLSERRERALALIRSMQLPDPERIFGSYPHQLSGGQCQRVIIAMALAMNPEVLIADEPTTALDVTTQAQVLKLIRELRTAQGHAILFITHDFGVVAEIADRIAVMRHGRIIEMGVARDVLTQPQHPYTRELLAAVPSLVPPSDPGLVAAVNKPVLAVTGLKKSYGRVNAVNEISFDLDRGTTLSIVGESGCGKSSLARLIVRLTEPTAGRVDVNGKCFLTLTGGELRTSCRAVQMIFQDPFGSLNPLRRVGAVIARAAMLAGADRRAARDRAGELIDRVGLSREALERRPAAFSGGQKQRIGIARALAMNPDVLIADESLSALDASSQAQILALLRKLQNELGLAILLITHDLRVAAQISHRIAVMQAGRIVEIGPAAQVINSPEHAYTRELLDSAPGRGLV